MREKRKSNFGDKIGRNLQHRKKAKKSYGYLNLPKGLPILNLKEGTQRIDLDFLPYVVTKRNTLIVMKRKELLLKTICGSEVHLKSTEM